MCRPLDLQSLACACHSLAMRAREPEKIWVFISKGLALQRGCHIQILFLL